MLLSSKPAAAARRRSCRRVEGSRAALAALTAGAGCLQGPQPLLGLGLQCSRTARRPQCPLPPLSTASATPASHSQVHTWRQEVLRGALPQTQPTSAPNGATNGSGAAPLLTEGSGDGTEEGESKVSRASTPHDQQVVSPAHVRPEAAAKERAVLSAADASALPPADKVPRSKSRWAALALHAAVWCAWGGCALLPRAGRGQPQRACCRGRRDPTQQRVVGCPPCARSLRRFGDQVIGCMQFRMTKRQVWGEAGRGAGSGERQL